MTFEDILVLVILALILAAAIMYVVRAKKKGAKCIGCPHANTCQSKAEAGSENSCTCGCNEK